jgi:hypothetical protein
MKRDYLAGKERTVSPGRRYNGMHVREWRSVGLHRSHIIKGHMD